MIDPAEAEDSENNRAQEGGHRNAKARAKAKVGESSLKSSFQFKKSTVVTQKKEHLTGTFLLLLERSLRQCLLRLVRNEVAKQEMLSKLRLWKRNAIFVDSENK